MVKGFEPSIEDEMREIRKRNEQREALISEISEERRIRTGSYEPAVKRTPRAIRTFGAEAHGRYLIAGTRANPIVLDNRTSFGYYQDVAGAFRLFRVDETMWQKWVDGDVITVNSDKGITWYPGYNSDNGADVVDTFRKLYELDKAGELPGPDDSALWGFRDFDGAIELITI